MIWLGVRLLGLLLTRAWGLIIAGIIVAGIGGGLFPSHSGATVTPGYTKGCINAHAYSEDGSSHQLTLGPDQPATTDTCPVDASQAGIGYQFATSDLSPSFPPMLQESGIVLVEAWYQPDMSNGTCGPSDDQHSCQIATVVALRTYTADGSGNLVVGTLYKTSNFTLGPGDLTQQGYNPNSASYAAGSPILPLSLVVVGALIFLGGIVWLILRRGSKRGKRTPQQGTIAAHMGAAGGGYSQPVYSQTPGYSQPIYPQQPGYSQPVYPQQPSGSSPLPGYAQPTYPQPPPYPQRSGSGQWPNQRP